MPTLLQSANPPTKCQPSYKMPTLLQNANPPTKCQPSYKVPTLLQSANPPTKCQPSYKMPTLLQNANPPTKCQPSYKVPHFPKVLTLLRSTNPSAESTPLPPRQDANHFAQSIPLFLKALTHLQRTTAKAPALRTEYGV